MLKVKTTLTTPVIEPVTLTEMKAYLRVAFTSEDAVITELIKQAREQLENATGRSFVAKTVELFLDNYFRSFRLPYTPIESVELVEVDGVDASDSLSDGFVVMKAGSEIKAEYTLGVDAALGLKMAIFETVAFWYSNRGVYTFPPTVHKWIQLNNQGWFI
jgi:uncharacterized phiE125 gp8 family phage protein